MEIIREFEIFHPLAFIFNLEDTLLWDMIEEFLQQSFHNLFLNQMEMIINYNSKREDLEEEDQRQDERNVIL